MCAGKFLYEQNANIISGVQIVDHGDGIDDFDQGDRVYISFQRYDVLSRFTSHNTCIHIKVKVSASTSLYRCDIM